VGKRSNSTGHFSLQSLLDKTSKGRQHMACVVSHNPRAVLPPASLPSGACELAPGALWVRKLKESSA
jgi:hypothetical protein